MDVTFEEKELLEKIFFVRNESNIVFNCEPKKLKRTLVLFESELISLTAASGCASRHFAYLNFKKKKKNR